MLRKPLTVEMKNSLLGIAWMIGWAVCINSAMVFAKQLTPGMGNAMIIFIRNLFGALLLSPLMLNQGRRLWKSQQPWRQALNALLIVSAMGCTYYAYRHLPLAFATSIGFSGPLMTTLFAILFLQEQVGLKKWIFILLGYVGVIIILHPIQVMFSSAVLILLAANLLASLAIINRKILLRTDKPESILAVGTLSAMVLSGVVSLFFWESVPVNDLLTLMVIGAFGVTSQFCYLNALKNSQPSYISPFEYTRLLVALPFGIFMFAEIPSFGTVFGGFVILVSATLLARHQIINIK